MLLLNKILILWVILGQSALPPQYLQLGPREGKVRFHCEGVVRRHDYWQPYLTK